MPPFIQSLVAGIQWSATCKDPGFLVLVTGLGHITVPQWAACMSACSCKQHAPSTDPESLPALNSPEFKVQFNSSHAPILRTRFKGKTKHPVVAGTPLILSSDVPFLKCCATFIPDVCVPQTLQRFCFCLVSPKVKWAGSSSEHFTQHSPKHLFLSNIHSSSRWFLEPFWLSLHSVTYGVERSSDSLSLREPMLQCNHTFSLLSTVFPWTLPLMLFLFYYCWLMNSDWDKRSLQSMDFWVCCDLLDNSLMHS